MAGELIDGGWGGWRREGVRLGMVACGGLKGGGKDENGGCGEWGRGEGSWLVCGEL